MKFQRVVLDTNVLASALMTPSGNPASVYKMFLNSEVVLVYSEEIMLEYEDVLYRPRLKIPAEDADTILEAIRQYGELVAPSPSTVALADEDDRVFYDAARTAGAYLITGNMRHYPASSFIFTPKEFLEL
jgi:putative PIN family toxin of toxin-antitoxin system